MVPYTRLQLLLATSLSVQHHLVISLSTVYSLCTW